MNLRTITKQSEMKTFMIDHEATLGSLCLTAQGVDLLCKAHIFLQPFASATFYAEGDKSALSQSQPLMKTLLSNH